MNKDQLIAVISVVVIITFVGIVMYNTYGNRAETAIGINTTPNYGVQTKTSGCQVRGPLQDPACTPGAIFKSATKAKICVPGYAGSARNVPQSVKEQAYREYGITRRDPGQYEVDHLISLQLGGSNDIANLWPEAASPYPGFHEKDRIENALHDDVCKGRISLAEAQREIATDWLAVFYRYYPDAPKAPDAATPVS
jgi:hypothetical protein